MSADRERFARLDATGAGAARYGRQLVRAAMDRAAFLGRLWALFGPPSAHDRRGFEYALVDRDTSIVFIVYSGATGCRYRSAASAETFSPVASAMEDLLARTAPVDCKLDLDVEDAEIDDSVDWRLRIGVRDGKPFERPVKKAWMRGTPKTYEDCVARAQQAGGRHGPAAGWHLALGKALPQLPDELEIDGRRYQNCIGFGFAKETDDVVYLFDEGPGIEEIPIDRIPWPRPLSATALLWLASYDRWRKEKRERA